MAQLPLSLTPRPAPTAASPAPLTVSELASAIQATLRAELREVWVVGEISNFHPSGSGHCYFTLKDDRSQISAVLFRSAAARLQFTPSDGLEALARGRVGFYEAGGKLQLYVESLEPRGLGALRLQLERLRAKLEAEGLLDPARKRPLPKLPRAIGIVTALGGAALQDMLKVLDGRFPNLRVVVRSVRVQGIGAEVEIAAGIREIEGVEGIEVVIVGRGGGSIEDLWAFNDEAVARAIAGCRVPIVSAVGHEIDVTIADLAADLRAPTPTAAAEMVVPRKSDLALLIAERRRALEAGLRRGLEAARRALESLRLRLRDPRRSAALARSQSRESAERLARAFARIVEERRDRVGQAPARLERGLRHRVEISRERLAGLSAKLSSLSPLAVLDRGYSLVWKAGEATPLRSAAEVGAGDELRVRLARGGLRARVEGREDDDAT
jgi:exodeoxyribonuclease VII large subunit